MFTVTLSQLLARGVRLETHEAVALARELLAHPCGIPTPENVQLSADGSASCVSVAGGPSVATVAHLLQTLLPPGTCHVPGPLRYTIARGLQAVEAPAFRSLGDFSSALARFEIGASRDVLRGVLARDARPSGTAAPPLAVAPAPRTPPATSPPPVASRPALAAPRTTLLLREPAASSNEPPQRVAAVPPMFRSFGVNGEPRSRVYSSRRWALAAAAALVASFGVGFAIGDGITRRAATQPFRSMGVSPGASVAAPEPGDSAAHAARVAVSVQLVRVPQTASGAREMLPPPRVTRDDAPTDATRGSVERAGLLRATPAVRTTEANAFSPAFASDGTTIFFHTGRDRDARSAIEVATPGSAPDGELAVMTIVDDGSRNYHPQPSPDGRLVAFDSDRDGQRGVYVANRDGSQVRRVSGAGYAAVPTWSRSSRWLAYIRPEADKPSVWNLWVQPVAGGAARRVTNHRYGQTWGASWFPDDRRIAYSHEDALVVMDLHTGKAIRYRTPVKGRLVRTPAVSPDGTMIIFQVFRHGAWLLDLADSSMHHVLTDPTAEEFAWSPDGRRVAFHSRRDGRWGIDVLSR